MAGPKENVTMKTIAEEAGVTLTTVSRILSNKGGKYADETKQRIFAIADRLKYRPNALVLGMQTGKTNTAGVMIPASEFFYSQIISGIHEVFLSNETIMLLSWNYDILKKEDEVVERRIIHQLIDRRVDGIILRPSCEEFERSYFEEIWERDIPLILVDREMAKVSTDFAGTDDEAGGMAAAEHFIQLGHREMLFVGEGKLVSTSRHREDGFRRVLSESPNACGKSVNIGSPGAKEILLQIFTQTKDRPTAVFCYNDPVAERVIQIIQEAGLSVPGDVSLIGFGNEPSGNCPIPLTTFDQHPLKIGTAAAQMYLDRVSGNASNGIRRELITPDLICRASTRTLSQPA